jgi:hypothetical protein
MSERQSIGRERRPDPRKRRPLLFVLRPRYMRMPPGPDKCIRLLISLEIERGGCSGWFWDWWLWRDFWRYGA